MGIAFRVQGVRVPSVMKSDDRDDQDSMENVAVLGGYGFVLFPMAHAWWARQDSNLQPSRYERLALTN